MSTHSTLSSMSTKYNNTEARRKSDRREHIFKLMTVGLSNVLGNSFVLKVPNHKTSTEGTVINISVVETNLFEIPELSQGADRTETETYNAQIFNGILDSVIGDGRGFKQGKRRPTQKTVKMNTCYAIDPFNEIGSEAFALGMEKILKEQLPKNVTGRYCTVRLEGCNSLIQNLYTSLLREEYMTVTGSTMICQSNTTPIVVNSNNVEPEIPNEVVQTQEEYQYDLPEVPIQFIQPQPIVYFVVPQSQSTFAFEFNSEYEEDREYCGFISSNQF